MKRKNIPLSEEIFLKNKKEIISKYENGYTAIELGEEFSICAPTLRKLLRKYGIKTRARGEPTKRQIEKMKNSFMLNYGVINPGQIEKNKESKSKKISDIRKKTATWCGEKNPNYNNKIGKNNGFKFGTREDLGNIFWRSSWEANTARILNFLKIEWIYENKHFKLENGKSYTPDFYLPKYNTYLEVKGFWRDDAKEKYELFCNKYKNFKVKLIDSNKYKWMVKRYSKNIFLEGVNNV